MEILVPAFVALLIGKPVIGALARLNIRQTIYEYAPNTHRAKEGTPTMGGFIMLVAVAAGLIALAFAPNIPALTSLLATHPALLAIRASPFALWFGSALLFALLGFADDYLIRRWLGRRGLEWKLKLLLQFLAAGVALYAIASVPPQLLRGQLPSLSPALPPALWGVGLVWVVAWVNAFNLTDGLDGLAAGLSVIAFGALAVLCQDTLSVGSALLWCGSVLGYLWWNLHPARVFMGDTGSMALGATFGLITWRELMLAYSHGAMATIGLAGIFVLVGLVFAVEMVSVVIQLSAVKLVGRRLFRATPIHHHFELLGWQESQIVGRFWLVGALAGLTAYSLWGGMR